MEFKSVIISEKGRREALEDSYFLDMNFANRGWIFGGIYDGHNGSFAAEYASENLHLTFLKELLSGFTVEKAFSFSYQQISTKLKNEKSGTTAVNFFIRDGEVFTANIGDSRAIVIGENKVNQLTIDHRVNNPEERERIKKSGGRILGSYVIRGFSGVMNTRVFGDQYFRPVGVISIPFLNRYKISKEDLFLIVGCDGLFDFMENEEVAILAREYPEPDQLAKALKKEVLINRNGTDNLTIITLKIKNCQTCHV
ncbi:MAG: hypothetical protein COY73_01145 [Candidatus Nealsonbacteria bacterium CG_4_10_14_0_8_um_filter_37_14]|uniref:PPM-type phosphatase domain-containing protein n=1 Tax=Candidatus Nealsonbacteria bacterium CG_4_10_14_0_8_um_filter_37_14 TaxID=1974684 RepID=A0A2M7R7J3_9BACT|nr:MAG: hypothetical protein COV63_01390 [Candidatus Nealsonbacteria bacterium CG11_big_fil_rev_8_21_14_0_20_37_68]PIW92278.1 MAG: hypothetical protein COZ89_00725 [Candidatus Nealsonbacteria bacterium CG_4_8_14_3_um_filter_37_23]PIY89352.1 MAG: hypothetical protein COY73_01145 [Candidatus Nealsonbacteria bacterium CG_4_10_14_0_8_um_filter_37_14]